MGRFNLGAAGDAWTKVPSFDPNCTSIKACRSVVQAALLPQALALPQRVQGWKACSMAAVDAKMLAADQSDPRAVANAYIAGCSEETDWTTWDEFGYYNASWLPGKAAGGADCRSITRFGPTWGPCVTNSVDPDRRCRKVDGGKSLCEAGRLLRPLDCKIVSVGINANTQFESSLHSVAPHCDVIGFDGTLDAPRLAKLPQFLKFIPQNFGPSSGKNFSATYPGRTVQLLVRFQSGRTVHPPGHFAPRSHAPESVCPLRAEN